MIIFEWKKKYGHVNVTIVVLWTINSFLITTFQNHDCNLIIQLIHSSVYLSGSTRCWTIIRHLCRLKISLECSIFFLLTSLSFWHFDFRLFCYQIFNWVIVFFNQYSTSKVLRGAIWFRRQISQLIKILLHLVGYHSNLAHATDLTTYKRTF